jgi:hypothetical protein
MTATQKKLNKLLKESDRLIAKLSKVRKKIYKLEIKEYDGTK